MNQRSPRRSGVGRLTLGCAALTVAIAVAPAAAGAMATPEWTIDTIAGTGDATFAGDGGPAALASLNEPRDSAIAPDGSIVVVDTFNNRIRRIAPDGTIATVAGTGVQGFEQDGVPATEAPISWPHDITIDRDGTIYFADSNNHRIRRIGLDGIIATVAGTGSPGSDGDGGPATEARIRNPKSVALYRGELFFTGLDDKVRAVDLATGIVRTVAGTGIAGFSGDGGPALLAQLDSPQRLQIDSTGVIYVADTNNHAVRRIDLDGIITTVAGVGAVEGLDGDGGPGVEAHLDSPRGIALDGDDLLYIADTSNHRVRVLDLTTGIVDAVAGTERGFAGDGGAAGSAALYQPRGLSVLPNGDVLVADTFNSRLRVISNPAPEAPVAAFTISCDGLTCAADGTASVDPDRAVVGWAWDFGDGTTATGRIATHTFAADGTYTVELVVTDHHGLTDRAVRSVTVSAPVTGPLPPVAGFTATCDALACAFDASPSNDPDGTLARWVWDFGDGTLGRRKLTDHTYPAAGSYLVTLTVTDDAGLATSVTQRLVVTDGGGQPNIEPVAAFTIDCSGPACTFDGTVSQDADGAIVDWQWDLGDGATASGATAAHIYGDVGSYLVTLTVTDDAGAVSAITLQADAF